MNKVFTAVLCLALAVIVHSEEDKKLVYGTDDRAEPYSITNANVLNLIQADVALMYASQLSKKSNSYKLSQKGTYDGAKCPNSYLEFCSSEPFKGQVSAAFCSGFLVRNDVNSSRIVTAGHCLNGFDCGQMAFIFDFAQDSASSINLDFPKSNVYFCKSFYFELDETSKMDFGVVELDRQVSGRTPLTMRTSGTVTVGTPLYMVGHPTGIPMKVADNAVVKSVSGVRFTGNTDSYAGNSGSMIVNANNWQVEGILVEGNPDFQKSGSCCVSNVCSDLTGCPSFEIMSQISQVQDYIYSDLPYADAWNMQPLMLLVVVLTFLAL